MADTVNGDENLEMSSESETMAESRRQLRRHWELASVLNFLRVFEPVIGKEVKMSALDIETALILPNRSLANLHITLLKGIPPVNKNLSNPDAWVTILCKKLAEWWPWVAEGKVPLTAEKGCFCGAKPKLESLPNLVAAVYSDNNQMQLEATMQFRKLLSIERSPPIEEVIQARVVPRFVEFLQREDFPQLQFEAAWALTNIASGALENTKVVIDHGAVPIFAKLLASPSDDVREQAVWALGNVAGDSPGSRAVISFAHFISE